ncbi:MAG: lamin tail domain-containing protein [Polyangiaceae bacterium]|nr:lamin tail domain-containing protein [Polyangiaceae bacterium]
MMSRLAFSSLLLVVVAACSHAEAVVEDDSGAAGAAGAAGGAGAAGATATAGKGGAGGGAAGSSAGAAGAAGSSAGAAGASAGAAGSAAGGASATDHLVVNEVATTGASADDEYVELFNPTSKSVSLDGWELKYAGMSGNPQSTWKGGSGDSISAGGYFVVAGSKFGGSSDGTLSFAMGKDGGGVGLFDGSKRVDSVAWNSGNNLVEGAALTAPHADGSSYSRLPDGADTDDNATDLKEGSRTPGAANQPLSLFA